MLLGLFERQVTQGFWVSLNWVPTADNNAADAITRSSTFDIVRLRPTRFQELQASCGDFTVDLMASSENAHLGTADASGQQQRLSFFSLYNCEGSSGVGVLSHSVAATPGLADAAFGFAFPNPVMAGGLVQHRANCRARVVVVVPDVRDYWFPRLQRAAVRERALPKSGTFGCPPITGTVRATIFA